jgi:Carboxypeptidase regulatory-like domain
MKYLFAVALLATNLYASSATKTQLAGEINGTLTDQVGSPVAGATVYAVPQFLTFEGTTPRSVKTNARGEFDFRGGFQIGTYKLYARKDEDGYPDPLKGFYADLKVEAPSVALTEDHRSATVKVKLGDRAGVMAGRVIDADSGAPVKAFLVFLDGDGNRREILADGQYREILPAGKDLILMVTALSPQSREHRPIAPLRLEPGQEIHQDISVSRQ